MHRLINEGHGHDSIVASYIEQVKRKDRLLLERDQKLDDLQTKNRLAEKDRDALQTQLGGNSSMSVSPAPVIIGDPKNETEAELLRVRA